MRWRWGAAIALALTGAAHAARPWREASSTHFLIYSQSDEPTLRTFATNLERFDKALRLLLADPKDIPGTANRLTIYVVPNESAVRGVLGPKAGRMVAGFYRPRAGGSLAFTPRQEASGQWDLSAQIILLHEYTHHFMFRYFPAAYPLWFSEGFAEYCATAKFEKDGGVGIGLPAMHRAAGLFYGAGLPLRDILADRTAKLNDEQSESIYSTGWLLTRYLRSAKERQGQLGNYLVAINAGKSAADAARAAFGDVGTLERELDRYKNRERWQYFAIPAKDLPIGAIAIRALSPGENAMITISMNSRAGVDDKEAQALVGPARAAAVPYPNDPVVQVELAEADFDAGDTEGADAAADRALAADPGAIRALLYKGMVGLSRAKDKPGDAAVWKAARGWITRANRLDPDDPRPFLLFYESFAVIGKPPTDNALIGLEQASLLAPEDPDVRLTLAARYAELHRDKEARHLLEPLAYAPHDEGERDVARKMLASLPDASSEAKAAAAPETPASPPAPPPRSP